MSISALQEAPDTFGSARVSTEAGLWAPDRDGDVITLPRLGTHTRLYPLLGGEQFVLITDLNRHGRDDPSAYFGGTDEQPFLVQLRLLNARVLLESSEAAFYESLKPYAIVQLERLLGPEATIRQGDIYAYPLPAHHQAYLPRKGQRRGKVRRHRPLAWPTTSQVFGTRHTLRGPQYRATELRLLGRRVHFAQLLIIGQGVLTAPDHETRILTGPHVIARSRSMVESDRYAD